MRATPDPGEFRSKIVRWCDVLLIALLTWQAIDALRPVTIFATGLVLAIRLAASTSRAKGRS